MTKPRDVERFPLGKVWVAAQWIGLAVLLLLLTWAVRGQSLLGSVSQTTAPVELSLRRAVELALAPDGNARAAIALEMVEEAKARSGQARADLLPNLDGAISQSSQTRNLEAFGIQLSVPVPGFEQPRFVGPFDVFDARLSATQSILNMSAVRRYQAAKVGVSIAKAEEQVARQDISASVAMAYYSALRAQAQRTAAEANLTLARDLEDLARRQKDAGTGLALEVTRATLLRSQAEHALLVRENEVRAANLQLQRTIGLSMENPIRLSDPMPLPETVPGVQGESMDSLVHRAEGARADWQGQQARLKNARLLSGAAAWERAPSISAFGDYGASGSSPGNALPTRAVGVQVRIPLFDGGRRDARRAESSARLREEELRARDLMRQIELELRLAVDALDSTREFVRVSGESLRQAELELEQARRRYRAGVAGSLEVTRAQTGVEQARSTSIDSLFRFNAARIEFAQAMGDVATAIP